MSAEIRLYREGRKTVNEQDTRAIWSTMLSGSLRRKNFHVVEDGATEPTPLLYSQSGVEGSEPQAWPQKKFSIPP